MANHMSNNNDDQGKNEQEDQGKSNGFLDWRGFPNGPNRWQTFFSVGLVVALLVFALRGLMGGVCNAPTDPLPTNTFVTAVKEDRVKDVTYKLSDSSVEGSYWLDKKDVGDMEKMRYFTSNYVGSDSLQELMAKHPAIIFKIDTRNSELWETLIATILPTVIVILALLYFMNQ
ncbi:MAG: hypothetical protein Q4G41_02150, partial [Coriobacteriales bacterium]|nr:hypothetical protein [Coriobacteriales bacterium]